MLWQVREALERAAAAFPEEKADDDMFGDDFGADAVRCSCQPCCNATGVCA
jgi:hypothetical protein